MMDIDNPPPQDSDSVATAAQSLRAAALLSRKRRRVAVEQAPGPPQRPQGEQSMQLDYGQEEIATSPASSFSTQNKVSSASEEPPPYSTPEIEDGQIREEGEISDTEDNAPLPAPRPTSPPPKFRRLEISSSKDSVTSRPVPTSPVIDLNPPLRSSTRLDSPFVPSRTASETESFHHPSPTFSHPFILENSTYRFDADHVRPGLAMTQDQYNTAKDIVLDLLGWGVPPEYLVDCNLSRHVVFYVFTELNLRMPTNLDTTGLIPYPEMMSSAPPSPSHSIRSVSTSSAMPPPMAIPSHREFSSPIATSGHTSDRPGSRLAARLGLHIPSAAEPVDVKMEPTSPSRVDSPSSQSLHMIEQQRRQELLARKAATASRKAKQFDSPSDPSSIRNRDVEKAHVAATETVEDFLKSIPAVDNEITDIPAAARYSSPEAMDINEAFVAPQSASSEGPSGQTPFTSTDSGTSEERSTISPVTDAPPSSAHSIAPSSDIYSGVSLPATSMPGDYVATSSSTTPALAYTTSAYDINGLQRRSTKRPVAADFVDFDHGPGPSRAPSGNGYSSNGYIHPIPLLRRKTGSFAGVSGMRRCVIELSDSEDDGDGEGIGGAALYDGLSYSPMIASARPRLGGNGASYSFSNGEGRSTPPNAPLGMSPAALAEKEEEIKKMRQMIAQREELRQRKLAAMSGKGTPTTQPTAVGPSTTDGVVVSVNSLTVTSEGDSRVPIKQEDNAVFFHNGHVGNAPPSEYVDAIMGDAQDNSELTADQEGADNSMVIPLEEPASGESSDLTSANQTIGGVGFEPINYDGNVDEDQEEARLEHWVSSNPTLHQTAGESDVPSSSQVPKKESEDIQMSFASYDSPFSSYPLMLSQLRSATVDAESSRRTASHSARSSRHNASSAHDISSFSLPTSLIYCAPSLSHSSAVFVPDLKPLKLATLQRALGRLTAVDSGLRVCQYEVPGGGVCRDKDCNDLHLSRLVSEPSDAELAAYVHGILPPTWRSRCDVRAIEIALERVRLGGSATNVDERVRDALAGLGIPVAPSIES